MYYVIAFDKYVIGHYEFSRHAIDAVDAISKIVCACIDDETTDRNLSPIGLPLMPVVNELGERNTRYDSINSLDISIVNLVLKDYYLKILDESEYNMWSDIKTLEKNECS